MDCSISGREAPMRKSGLTRLPLKDRSFIREVFAELCADASIVHANVHIVLAALAFDLPKAVPARAVVSARIVMPNTGAAEFRDLLPNCGQMHEAATDHR